MISDFLDTKLSKEKLANALEVIEHFKSGESDVEWLTTNFSSWSKLEQLEEFLNHLVKGEPLAADTLEHLRWKEEVK